MEPEGEVRGNSSLPSGVTFHLCTAGLLPDNEWWEIPNDRWQKECKRFLLANSYNIYSQALLLEHIFPIKSTCEQKLNIEIIFFTPWPPYGGDAQWKYSRESIKKRGTDVTFWWLGIYSSLSVQTSEDLLVSLFYRLWIWVGYQDGIHGQK